MIMGRGKQAQKWKLNYIFVRGLLARSLRRDGGNTFDILPPYQFGVCGKTH